MKDKHQKADELANILFPDEDQQKVADSILQIPPEQRRLHTDSYDFTVSTLVEYLKTNRIKVPVYQRRYVWTDAQASRLIESLIIQCPIPILYLHQEKDESLSVIDGNQRLTSLRRYINNEFSLIGLTAYPELEGLKFFELDPRFQRHIENRTIRCLIILKETHPQVKFDVFERLNSGSVKLTPQELRHGIYYGHMVELCEVLAKNKRFGGMINVGENKRMKLEELVLRFLALRFGREDYRKPLSGFLNNFAERYRILTELEKSTFTHAFTEAVEAANELYGDYAFQLITPTRKVISRFNSALFDAEMLAASTLKERGKPLPKQKEVLDVIEAMLKDEENPFRRAIVQATSDEVQVKNRIELLIKSISKL